MQADRNLAVPDSFMLASFMVESSSRRRQVRINNFVTLTRSWGLPLEVLGNRSASLIPRVGPPAAGLPEPLEHAAAGARARGVCR